MKIEDGQVVSFHFTLKDEQGKILESSAGSEPLVYMHGAGNIVPGLEEALVGKTLGDKFQVTLAPEKAYGHRDERLLQKIPKAQFPDPEKIEPGMQFQANSPEGAMIITISGVEGDDVIVDGNPELAGMILIFDIEVTAMRPATQEEMDHGHAHGPGGHHPH